MAVESNSEIGQKSGNPGASVVMCITRRKGCSDLDKESVPVRPEAVTAATRLANSPIAALEVHTPVIID
ncbi:hypothetical protein [Streptomyces sp. NPDC127084]|uniref:hypothetical protein n=1 Tax=Streptomyces sp. NPDC127084 TaxID=3347133 RepID=UPI003663A4A1